MEKTKTAGRVALAFLTAGLLAGCMASARYAPKQSEGGSGYTDQRISDNRYRVTFTGNAVTSRETIENFLLLRAAEVTLDSHYPCFSFADRDTQADVHYYTTFNDFGWYPGWRGHGWYHHSWDGDPWGPDYDVHQIKRFDAYAEIVMGPCRNDNTDLNAQQIVDHLGPMAAPPPPQ